MTTDILADIFEMYSCIRVRRRSVSEAFSACNDFHRAATLLVVLKNHTRVIKLVHGQQARGFLQFLAQLQPRVRLGQHQSQLCGQHRQ